MKRVTISESAAMALIVAGTKPDGLSPNDDETYDLMLDDGVYDELARRTGGQMSVEKVSKLINHLVWGGR